MNIQVGQYWKTRDGAEVHVTHDRGEGLTWRWALSNSEIANTSGYVGFSGELHGSDLVELSQPAVDLPPASVDGMDSTLGGLR